MIRLGRRTLALLVVAFVVLPIVDIWLLFVIGSRTGAMPVLLVVIAEAILGGWLIRRRWRSVWRSLQDPAAREAGSREPGRSVGQAIDTVLFVAGGLALMFPGPITDLIGILCLIPFTRALVARTAARRMPALGGLGLGADLGRRPAGYGAGNGDVIEGEVVEAPADRPGPTADGSEGPVIIRGEVGDR